MIEEQEDTGDVRKTCHYGYADRLSVMALITNLNIHGMQRGYIGFYILRIITFAPWTQGLSNALRYEFQIMC